MATTDDEPSPPHLIQAMIEELEGWRGETLTQYAPRSGGA